MNARDPGTDACLDWLRRAHRSERAPEELRCRVRERARGAGPGSAPARPRSKWPSRGGWLALAAAVAGGVAWGVSRSSLEELSRHPAAVQDVATPTAEPSRAGAPAPACPPASPWLPSDVDLSARLEGFVAQSLELETPGCGRLTRRYLVRAPEPRAPHLPVLIVLHDAGQSPEQAQIATRWWYDNLAQRMFAVLVYANGLPPARPFAEPRGYEGVWQTDADSYPQVDDVAYLDAIVGDLRARHGLAQGEVFLLGQGSGGVLALAAALQHPERYAGVAAFLPPRAPTPAERSSSPAAPGPSVLRSIFIALPRSEDENPSQLVVDWAASLGSDHGAISVQRQKPGVRRIDSTLAGGRRLRIVSLPKQVDPFPGPGGADPLARHASEKSPTFFDGPGAAWELFQIRTPVPPIFQPEKP